MYTYVKNKNTLLIIWLTISLILIFLMIIIGGLTRLTDSGLSITEWELFKGLLPPLNDQSWIDYFEQYKKIPQFILLNPDMSLHEFKIIFYWEYFHRILGRLIGIFFLIPLLYFHFTKKINHEQLKTCYLIFFLILFQGAMGWYMVKSGLVDKVTVSHYRLSAHLSIALLIISMIFWLVVNCYKNTSKKFFNFSKNNFLFQVLFLLLFLQIIFGAFVSGLDAGRVYQTWPLMGQNYFPDDFELGSLINWFNFENHSLVQFYHRNLAYIITIYLSIIIYFILKNKMMRLYKPVLLIVIFLCVQIILGILTLISGLNIYLASAHQVTSVLLIFSALNLYYYFIK